MSGDLEIRPLDDIEDARSAAALIDRIWGEQRIVSGELLLAMASHGSLALGAFEEGRIVGAQMGFVGIVDGQPRLHSHVTGIDPAAQRRGLGYRMKVAQREWCLVRGIEVVTWTFDPMIARNAHFNLHKLGALGVGFARNYYGPMDDAFNAGERTDRMDVRWELRSERVEAAVGGRPRTGEGEDPSRLAAARRLVRIPEDYLALRASDPEAASRSRDEVAVALEEAFAEGYVAVDLLPGPAYALERP